MCSASSLSWLNLLQPIFVKNIEVVIFDCDGILVDTEYLKFLAWQEALQNYGIDFSIEEYMPLIGHSSKSILHMVEKTERQKD